MPRGRVKGSKNKPEDPAITLARHRAMQRQHTVFVYGDGPFEPEIGYPCGNEDVARIELNAAFVIVRTEYLDALEAEISRLKEIVDAV